LSHATWRNSILSFKETIGTTLMVGAITVLIEEPIFSIHVGRRNWLEDEEYLVLGLVSQEPLSCLLITPFRLSSNSGRWTLGTMKDSNFTLTTKWSSRKPIKSARVRTSVTMSTDGTLSEKISTSELLT